jgi:hypothetical protein
MPEDDNDRASELESEREAEIESEMERVDQDPEQVDEGTDHLGKQSADSGTSRPEAADENEEPVRAEAGGEGAEEDEEEGE